MKILDRYILKSFLVFLFVTLFMMILLVLLLKFVDQLDIITKSHVPAKVVLEYLMYLIPASLTRIVPISVVISVLILLLTLNLHHELIAIQASGISRMRLVYVVVFTAVFISLLYGGINEYIAPDTTQKAKTIKLIKIDHGQSSGYVAEEQTWLRGPSGEFYSIGLVGPEAKFLNYIHILKLNPNRSRILSEVYIQKAIWDAVKRHWNVEGVRERSYDDQQNLIKDTAIPAEVFDMTFTPGDFIQVVQRPEEMNTRQLWEHLQLLRQGGLDTRESLTYYYLRFANILGPVILAIIGLGYGFVMTRTQAASGFAWAILLAVSYIILSQYGLKLGKAGIFSPLWSAWVANIILGIWGIFRLKKVLS